MTKHVKKSPKAYKNQDLSFDCFRVEYIVRLGSHGNVIEHLFDRERDIPKPMPELKTGMFGETAWYDDKNKSFEVFCKFVVVGDKVVYQDDGFDEVEEVTNQSLEWAHYQVTKIYSSDCVSFGQCTCDRVLWVNPEYDEWLDSQIKE